MLVLNIFCMSNVRGTVSKALLMSIVARSVLCAGLGILRPSCMYYVSVVRSVVVECKALKPCCVLRISLSRISNGMHHEEIGL